MLASPVKQVAQAHSIDVFQPSSLKTEASQEALAAQKPDLMIVAAYGLILPKAVLDIPQLGCINIHASLLPRWRGAAPIQRAIQAGDTETGITIMQMDEGLDTGDMLLKKSTVITQKDTGGSLHDRLAKLGAEAILEYLKLVATDQPPSPQSQTDSEACYAAKLSKQEAQIDWTRTTEQIGRDIRAFNPWPVAFIKRGSERIRVFSAQILDKRTDDLPGKVINKSKDGIDIATGSGILRITQLQLPGGKVLSAQEFFNGGKTILEAGEQL